MMEEQLLIYVDETTVNLWETQKKLFLKEGMTRSLLSKRGKSWSIIGGIDKNVGLRQFLIVPGSNNE